MPQQEKRDGSSNRLFYLIIHTHKCNLKKIDKLVISSFVGPYVLSFFVAEFVLIMQFLWKYIDEILGKGFSVLDIMELILYYGMTIVPMALPISILIASVMVFGNISERNELTTMKSSGISLLRVMRPGIVLAIFTTLFSLFASNYLKPAANFQFKKRFDHIRRQKSNLAIEEGVFNDDFRNYVIRAGKKSENGIDLNDVLIYDNTRPDKSLLNVISSDSAKMYTTESGKYFVMDLKKGSNFQEGDRKVTNGNTSYPMTRTYFDQWTKVFDMSEFHLDQNDININRKKEDMLNTMQLISSIDTFMTEKRNNLQLLTKDFNFLSEYKIMNDPEFNLWIEGEKKIKAKKDSIEHVQKNTLNRKQLEVNRIGSQYGSGLQNKHKIIDQIKANKGLDAFTGEQIVAKKETEKLVIRQRNIIDLNDFSHFYETLDSSSFVHSLQKAILLTNAKVENARTVKAIDKSISLQIEMYRLRLHQQYSFAFICILFLFIGAPLGSIIRKGGYGYPLLIAILFYMLFIISSILGEKLVKNETLYGAFGAWLPCLIQLPLAIFFTHKALNDSRFNGLARIEYFVSRMFSRPAELTK